MHADLALCEGYVDADRTQGERAADTCSLTMNADWMQARDGLNAIHVHTDDCCRPQQTLV